MTCLPSSRIHTIGTVPRRDPDAAPQTRQSTSLHPLTAILTIRSASKPCTIPYTRPILTRDIPRQSPSLRPLTAILTIRSASKPCAVPRTQQRNPRDVSRQSPSLHPQTEIRKET